jgi:hypothetical protein
MIRWYRAMRELFSREWGRLSTSDDPGERSLSESVRNSWWSWISADQNDRISIFTPVGACVGAQWMLAAFFGFSIKSAAPMWDQLTQVGRAWFQPDRDIPFYVFGSCIAVLMVIVLERAWRRRSERPGIKASTPLVRPIAIVLALVPTIPFFLHAAFRSGLLGTGGLRRSSAVLLMLPGLVAAAVFSLLRGRIRWADEWAAPWALNVLPPDGDQKSTGEAPAGPLVSARSVAHRLFDAAMVAFVASLIYINDWRLISYQTYNQDYFFHWDFYFMGSAVEFFHGRALGTDAFSQYGVGWPVLTSWLSVVTPIDHSTCAGVFVLCGTLYFALYYLTLRYVAGNTLVAGAAFFVMVNVQLFHGLPSSSPVTMWIWPSSTVLRSLFDLAFFFMLAVHGRSGRPRWMIASAAVVGLGLLFEIDTGLYLLASLFYYLFVTWLPGERGAAGPWSANVHARTIAAVAAALISVMAAGLYIASRGTLFSPGFFNKWLEGISVFSKGFSSLPVAGNRPRVLALFLALVGMAICAMVVPILRRRPGRLGFVDRYMGCWGAYAWCSMVLFVNRSHEWNIFHCILPYGVLMAYLTRLVLDRSLQFVANKAPHGSGAWLVPLIRRCVPGLAMAGALAVLWVSPMFRCYPNLWHRFEDTSNSDRELCLMHGVCGFPKSAAKEIGEFHAVTEAMAGYRAAGQSVEIIHFADTMFYLASGCPPLDRYSPLPANLMTKHQLTEALARFDRRKTSHVLIQGHSDLAMNFRDTWSAFHNALAADYEIEKRIGGFEVWRLRSADSSASAPSAGLIRNGGHVSGRQGE